MNGFPGLVRLRRDVFLWIPLHMTDALTFAEEASVETDPAFSVRRFLKRSAVFD
jgi:hypothetical protein